MDKGRFRASNDGDRRKGKGRHVASGCASPGLSLQEDGGLGGDIRPANDGI